jgi:hypothetical protein
VALQIECRTTKKSPERRQRVLISNKYTEAVVDVNRKLDQIAASINDLNNQQQRILPAEQHISSVVPKPEPDLLASENAVAIFRGESSFEAHAKRLRTALEKTHGVDLSRQDGGLSNGVDQLPSFGTFLSGFDATLNGNYISSKQSLPPTSVTLNLLRLITVEQQRFFIDVPVIDESDFTAACQQIYFSPQAPSIAAWASTNVGLYYLIHDLQPDNYIEVGLTTTAAASYLAQLSENIFRAMHCLNLCSLPTFESCQAIALMGAFAVKSGRIETAWRLITFAIRMCMDLGMHRINPLTERLDAEGTKRNYLFWWLYFFQQPLALTLGRPSVVRMKDVETRPGQLDIKRHAGYDRSGIRPQEVLEVAELITSTDYIRCSSNAS